MVEASAVQSDPPLSRRRERLTSAFLDEDLSYPRNPLLDRLAFLSCQTKHFTECLSPLFMGLLLRKPFLQDLKDLVCSVIHLDAAQLQSLRPSHPRACTGRVLPCCLAVSFSMVYIFACTYWHHLRSGRPGSSLFPLNRFSARSSVAIPEDEAAQGLAASWKERHAEIAKMRQERKLDSAQGVTSLAQWGQTLSTLRKVVSLKLSYAELMELSKSDREIYSYLYVFVLFFTGNSAKVKDVQKYLVASGYRA
ncbi:unnamed protein product, partial [Symbiodinium necroappetens]